MFKKSSRKTIAAIGDYFVTWSFEKACARGLAVRAQEDFIGASSKTQLNIKKSLEKFYEALSFCFFVVKQKERNSFLWKFLIH